MARAESALERVTEQLAADAIGLIRSRAQAAPARVKIVLRLRTICKLSIRSLKTSFTK